MIYRDKSLRFTLIYAGDGIHLSAISLIVGWILHKRTCKGISGRTQIIVALVDFLQFVYAAMANKNLFEEAPEYYSLLTNGVSSIVSAVLMYLMYGKYKKTIEKDFDTFWIELLIILCGGFALVANPVYVEAKDKSETDPLAVIVYMSMYLGSVSILPQIYFNFRTGSKTLCMSLYVLLSTLTTFFYMYYLLTSNLNSSEIDFNRLEATPKYTIYPECAQLVAYALFFILLVVVPKYEEVLPLPLSDVESTTGSSVDGDRAEESEKNNPPVIIVTRPQLDRQQSLLETPFLKKSLPSSTSVLSSSPEEASKQAIQLFKTQRQQSTQNAAKIMRLTRLKRAKTSASELQAMGDVSPPSTPEDEKFLMFKETALQSRRRRIRRRSLPTTPTVSSEETSTNADSNNDKVKFQIGDIDLENEVMNRKQRKTLSFEKFLAAQTFKPKQEKIGLEVNYKNVPNPRSSPKNLGGSSEEQTGAVANRSEPLQSRQESKTQPGSAPKKPKIPDTSAKKSRRATAYQIRTQSPQMQNNWKTLATNFLGTGPIDVRRPSIFDLSPREQARIDKRRRNRIFSVA